MILINVVTTPGESKNDLLYRCKNGLTLPCSVFTSSTYFIYDSFFLEGKRQFSSSRGAPLLLAVRRAMTFSAVPLISGILLTFFLITNAYPDILLLEKYQGRSSLTGMGRASLCIHAIAVSSSLQPSTFDVCTYLNGCANEEH